MNVLITGGNGFLGRRVLSALLERGALPDIDGVERGIERIRLADLAFDPGLPDDPRVETSSGDFSDSGMAEELLGDDTQLVFHLAAIVSGQAEQDFELGMKVNLDGTRHLLDACKGMPKRVRVLFASSVAAYGGALPEVVGDGTSITPENSYGTQKAVCELLINDYSRKGFVDGRALRLPTVVVRPGKPNAAASSFASAIIREPLSGQDYVCPVGEETNMWLLSPRKVVAALMHAAALPEEAFSGFRAVALPGITLSVGDMVAALARVAGQSVVRRLRFERDPFIENIINRWATHFETPRGTAMGFERDESMDDVIRAFIEDELNGSFVS